ncbi:MAG: 30S ribosomal protein S12 methylthiotransferase RimO [Lachnospiraceae bacterium]|nr:30S ribosomal protein S12 methylthiotransferase RimO [Lachnospiraceae bacterium]
MNVYFVSLGCDKNLVDSEHMLADISTEYTIVDSPEEAEIAIVNTCAFIKDAKEESVNTILELAGYKEGKLKYLVVTGCLAQRYYEELQELIPEIDVLLGISAVPNILEDLKKATGKKKRSDVLLDVPDINKEQKASGRRFINPPFHYSYLKIAEGCDKKCTYCAIPSIRGKYRSVPMEELVKETEYLAENYVSEIILVAQETTVYGMDIYGKKSLCELVEKISRIEGIRWIRLMYCYPEEIDDDLISLIKNNPKVCHYLDMPIQHSSDRILKMMGRRTTGKDISKLIKKLRKEIPDIALRTSLIAGFPTEEDEDFENLAEFVKKAHFNRLGVFTYSKEENTPASKFKPQVKSAVKKKRQKELMKIQREISLKNNSKLKGKTFEAVIDGYDSNEDVYTARLYFDAPDIDGCVFIKSDEKFMSGTYVNVKITDYSEYDLIGEIKK